MRISLSILHLSIPVRFLVFLYLFQISHFNYHMGKHTKPKTDFWEIWRGGQGVGLVIWWLQSKPSFQLLTGIVLDCTEFNSLAMLFIKHLVWLLPDDHVYSFIHVLNLKRPHWGSGQSSIHINIHSPIPTYVSAHRLPTLLWNWT